MESENRTAVVTALRTALADETPAPPSDVLIASAEEIIFRMRALAPPPTVAERALHDHLQACEIDPSESVAYADWQASLRAVVSRFLTDPAESTASACEDFVASCSRVFGIDEDGIATLLMRFSQMTEEKRMGVILAIEESPSFAYLSRQIDDAPDDTPFENPTLSLRELLRETIAEL